MNQEDVWSKIFVATNQDEWIGRRRSQLSVCMCHIYYIRKLCSNASKAPLKLRSQSLGLETHLIPSKSTFKDWKVHSHASHYDHMLKTFSHNPQPPAHFTSASSSSNNLLVTASFGRLLADRLLHLFPVTRRLNVHPSLIPLYRGPAPIQHAIADGREETGVSVLEMKEKKYGADGGEVWASKTVVSYLITMKRKQLFVH